MNFPFNFTILFSLFGSCATYTASQKPSVEVQKFGKELMPNLDVGFNPHPPL